MASGPWVSRCNTVNPEKVDISHHRLEVRHPTVLGPWSLVLGPWSLVDKGDCVLFPRLFEFLWQVPGQAGYVHIPLQAEVQEQWVLSNVGFSSNAPSLILWGCDVSSEGICWAIVIMHIRCDPLLQTFQ